MVTKSSEPAIKFRENSLESKTGYFQINWDGELKENCLFELSQSKELKKIIYRGKENASFISGKRDGNYQYKIATICPEGTSISPEALSVTVKHYDAQLASTLFAVGLLSFVVLAAVIFYQDSKTKT